MARLIARAFSFLAQKGLLVLNAAMHFARPPPLLACLVDRPSCFYSIWPSG